MTARILLLMAALSFIGCQSVPSEAASSPSDSEFAQLMKERLAYAPRIAWIKYQSGQPISDHDREVVILQKLEAAGEKLGLDPRRVREFFSAQMEAFQQVQRDEINQWNSGRPAPAGMPMDLQTEIRPAIEKLNGELLALLARRDVGHTAALAGYCKGVLREAGFSETAAGKAVSPIPSARPWTL
jgi:chorismate mutase